MSERSLGRIVRLQVQRAPVKHKGSAYDPGPILFVDRAAIGPGGTVGWTDRGWVLDVHHAAHPSARGGGTRPLSIGFTGHYALMAERFGDLPVGIAGENVIVDHDGRVLPEDLQGAVVLRTAVGDVAATGARVAAPCREFTSFLLGLDRVADRTEIGDEMEFLERGTRGFILDVSGLDRPMSVAVGDEVLVLRR